MATAWIAPPITTDENGEIEISDEMKRFLKKFILEVISGETYDILLKDDSTNEKQTK